MFHFFYVTDGEADAVFLYASYYLKACSPVSFQELRRPINSPPSLVPDVCSTVRCGFDTSNNRTDTSKLTFGKEFPAVYWKLAWVCGEQGP